MIEKINNFKELAINGVKNNREILEHWKQSSHPCDRALAELVFSEAKGEI